MRRKMKPEDYPPYTPPPLVLPDDDASAILEIREFAVMVWNEITMVFGPSIHFVRMITSPRRFYRQTLDWLRNLELLVRRLITITALSMKLPPVKPWKFHPYMATKGQHAVRQIMPLAVGLCQRALNRWQGLEPRPG